MNREIPKNPETAELNERQIELLTELCFRENDKPEPVDGIFVFSSFVDAEKIASILKELLVQGISKEVFITGGESEKMKELHPGLTEAQYVLNAVNPSQFPDVVFHKEEKSTNTLENVTEMLKVKDFSDFKKLFFIFKSHAAGRGYLTLRRFLPDADILQKTFNAKYPELEKEITRDNWYIFAGGRKRVWGEFLRIKKYGERGDIAYDEVKDIIGEIEK